MSYREDAKMGCVEDIKAADRQAALVLSEIASTRRPLGSAIDRLRELRISLWRLQRARQQLRKAEDQLKQARRHMRFVCAEMEELFGAES